MQAPEYLSVLRPLTARLGMPSSKKQAHRQLTQEERWKLADAKERSQNIKKEHKKQVRNRTAAKTINTAQKKAEKLEKEFESKQEPEKPQAAPADQGVKQDNLTESDNDLEIVAVTQAQEAPTESDTDLEIVAVTPAPAVNPDLIETESDSE